MSNTYRTGYFASQQRDRPTKVHVVDGNDSPVCGATLGGDMIFQWCAQVIRVEYIECKTCKRIANRVMAKSRAIADAAVGEE